MAHTAGTRRTRAVTLEQKGAAAQGIHVEITHCIRQLPLLDPARYGTDVDLQRYDSQCTSDARERQRTVGEVEAALLRDDHARFVY